MDKSIEYLFFKLCYFKAKLQKKLRMFTDCESTCQFLVDHVSAELSSGTPEPWWKFAVKAAYVRIQVLAGCMEFATPKKIMEEFVQPALDKINKKFFPQLQKGDMNYYSF